MFHKGKRGPHFIRPRAFRRIQTRENHTTHPARQQVTVGHGEDGWIRLAVRLLEKALQNGQLVVTGPGLVREQIQSQADVRVFPSLRRLFLAAGLVHALFVKAYLSADPQIGQDTGQLLPVYADNTIFKRQKFHAASFFLARRKMLCAARKASFGAR